MADDQFRDPAQRALGAWTPQCLSAAEMARLTSGAGDETGAELDHVATCDYCAAQLKLLMEMKTTSLPPEEEQVMRVLERSAPQAQARAVQKFRKSSGKPPWQTWAIAAGVILAVGSATVWWRYSEDPARQSSRLLAEAYTARRTFDWRLPDTGWTQRETQRGGAIQRPTPLLDAEALLARGGDRENDPHWMDLRARAEILDLQFDSAIMLLQRAIQLSPKSADLLADLAVAYGLSAESQDRPEQFAAAVEFSTRALAIDPQNRRALFNRALAFERLYMVDRAIEDWEQYLKIETDPAWAKEARTHLDQLRATQQKRARLMESDEESDAVLEQKAVRWLKEDRAKARAVGKVLLEKYGDRWLADAAEEPVDSEPLWVAVESYVAGRIDQALNQARMAVKRYTNTPAHLARALLETANSFDRSMRPGDCLRQATSVAASAQARSYQWIRVQALIQQSTCLDMLGNLSSSIQARHQAMELARQFRIDGLEFRAVGIEVSRRTAAGDLWAAWRDNRDGLQRWVVSPYSPIRIQQCLSNYSFSAELWGWRAASYEFARAGADELRSTPNRINEASNRGRAASLALEAHLHREYKEQVQKAEELFKALPESETRTRYLNSVRLLEGRSYLSLGRPGDAMRVLTPVAQAVALQREQWLAHQFLGLGLRRTKGPGPALPEFQAAVNIVSRRLATLPRAFQRSQARREGLDAYRNLADVLLDEDPSGARSLPVWLAANGSQEAPDVTFLALENGYAVWTEQGKHMHRVFVDRARVRQSISRLLAAAADPHRSPADVKREGSAVFNDVLRPALGSIPSGAVLTVLPDAEIAATPFQLLVDPQGRWLADYCTIVFAAHPRGGDVTWVRPQRALVIGSPATRELLPPLPDSRIEAEKVASRFAGSTLLTGPEATVGGVSQALEHAELFHYSGHGYAGAGVGGLYLADSVLTSVSLQQLSLQACRLVVLSTCLGAVGQTEGLTNPDSLVHALLDAGAQTVIASRWSVDSAATAALMARFYSDLQSTGDPAQSLRHVSQLVRALPQYEHPYYWGAFQTYE